MNPSSSSKAKKQVHYERGTKTSKSERTHRSTDSRDSGVGSSSASDRASVGTSPDKDSPFGITTHQQNDISALQNALAAAKDQIRRLEAANVEMNQLLGESHRENRTLKREKGELLGKIADLEDELADSDERARRDATPRTGAAAPAGTSKSDRRLSPPKRGSRDSREADARRREEEKLASRTERYPTQREAHPALYDRTNHGERPPTAPHPPLSGASNPFAPNPDTQNPFLPNPAARRGSVSYASSMVSYAGSGPVTYAPTPVTYTTAPPVYQLPPPPPPSQPPRSGKDFPNDGMYHAYPLR